MNLFGCKFCEKVNGEKICDRKNFDSLLWALVTVFQVDLLPYRHLYNYICIYISLYLYTYMITTICLKIYTIYIHYHLILCHIIDNLTEKNTNIEIQKKKKCKRKIPKCKHFVLGFSFEFFCWFVCLFSCARPALNDNNNRCDNDITFQL